MDDAVTTMRLVNGRGNDTAMLQGHTFEGSND